MAKPYFKFKQFTVYHDRSSLKVGTDAVLLGAWTDVADASEILDIGTGSGVIALMLAQRIQGHIDAIDIDTESCNQARENFIKSPWKNRLTVYNISLKEFVQSNSKKYDLIVSNPPYFTDSFKPTDTRRFGAKHNDTLPIADLAEAASKLLSQKGKFSVILPLKEAGILESVLKENRLFLQKELSVYPLQNKEIFRKLLLFGYEPIICKKSKLVIETDQRHKYTDEYINLTKDYYLNS